MSKINVPNLRKVLEHVTAHPNEWRQEAWAVRGEGEGEGEGEGCGTAYCLAGTAVALLADATFNWEHIDTFDVDTGGFTYAADTVTLRDGQPRSIEHLAGELLGLDAADCNALFWPTNGLRDLWELASHWTDGEIEVPSHLEGSET